MLSEPIEIDPYLAVAGGRVHLVDQVGEVHEHFEEHVGAGAYGIDACDGTDVIAVSTPRAGAILLFGAGGIVRLTGLDRPRDLVCGSEAIVYVGGDGLRQIKAEWTAWQEASVRGGGTLAEPLLVAASEAPRVMAWAVPDQEVVQVHGTNRLVQINVASGDTQELPFESPTTGELVNPVAQLYCFGAGDDVLCGEAGPSTTGLGEAPLVVFDHAGALLHVIHLDAVVTGLTTLRSEIAEELQQEAWGSDVVTIDRATSPAATQPSTAPPTTAPTPAAVADAPERAGGGSSAGLIAFAVVAAVVLGAFASRRAGRASEFEEWDVPDDIVSGSTAGAAGHLQVAGRAGDAEKPTWTPDWSSLDAEQEPFVEPEHNGLVWNNVRDVLHNDMRATGDMSLGPDPDKPSTDI